MSFLGVLTLRITGCLKLNSEAAQLWALANVYMYSYLCELATPWEVTPMRTNIEIDDKLMTDALKATGLRTTTEAVKLGLNTLIKLKNKKK